MRIAESTNPYMDRVFREAADRAEHVARERDQRDGPYMADIGVGAAQWHLIATHPAREMRAAAQLAARGFGVYVPEIGRGWHGGHFVERSVEKMFPSHVLLFCWGIEQHVRRIRACPGVARIMCRSDGAPIVVSDHDVAAMVMMDFGQAPRNRRKLRPHKAISRGDASVSPLAKIGGLDSEGRTAALHEVLGAVLSSPLVA